MISGHLKYIVILLLLLTGTAIAQDEVRDLRLNFLFEALKIAPDEISARTIEQDIWQLWMRSGDEDVDVMLDSAMEARRSYDYDRALVVLSEIIEIKPGFAEAWNQRAIVHFLRSDYPASLLDIAAVLEHEPRHFGALTGRAVIRFRQGKSALAFQNIRAAMKYHPYLPERELIPEQFRTD